MPWDFGAGVAAAAGAGASLMGDAIKRERDLQGAADLEALKEKIAQDKQARIAAILGGVSRTKTVDVADESGGHTVEQKKDEGEYRRERGDALTKAGLIDYSEKEYTAADRHEENMLTRKTQEAKQKSDDEKWHATNTELIRHHKSLEAKAAAQLGLKAQEAKDFSNAVDSYIDNKASYDSAVAQNATDEVRSRIKQDVERDALKLKQFRVDVGDQSDLAKHMSLSATLTALNKTIETKTMAGEDVAQDKKDRDAIVKKIGEIASGAKSGDAGSDFDAKFPPKNKPPVAAGGAKPAAPAFQGIQANVLRPEYGKGGMIQTRETL